MLELIHLFLHRFKPRKSFKEVVVGGTLICRQEGTQHVRVCIVKSVKEDKVEIYSPSLDGDYIAEWNGKDWFLIT